MTAPAGGPAPCRAQGPLRHRGMRMLAVLGTVLAVTAGPAAAAPGAGTSPPAAAPSAADLRTQATAHLKFLYAMYFAVRGCTEAAEEQAEPRFRPTVSLAEAQRVLRAADAAARAVDIKVDAAWLEMSAIGQAAGEALKLKSDENFQKCRQSGTFFRTITSKLQMAIAGLSGSIPLIEKDF